MVHSSSKEMYKVTNELKLGEHFYQNILFIVSVATTNYSLRKTKTMETIYFGGANELFILAKCEDAGNIFM